MEVLQTNHVNWIAEQVENGIQTTGIIEVLDKPFAKTVCKVVNLTLSSRLEDETIIVIHSIFDQIVEKDTSEAIALLTDFANRKIDIPSVSEKVEDILFDSIKYILQLILFKES